MIRTLHITSIIVAVVAAILFVFAAVYGVRSDPKIEEFLKSPGAVDKFAAAKGKIPAKDESQGSPLVRQAMDLSQHLNPSPPPPKPTPSVPQQQASQPAPLGPVSTKFDLVATSYFASNPDRSLALIDEPGKGTHWVKQGGAVEHLTIEKIQDGSITIKDGPRTSEMKVKVQETWRNLLRNPPPETRPVEISPGMSISNPPESPAGAGASSPGTTSEARQGVLPGGSQRITRPAGATSRFTRAGAKIPAPQPTVSDNKQPGQQSPVVEPAPATPQGQDMAGGMGQPTTSQAQGQQPADTPANQAVPAENANNAPSQPADNNQSGLDQLIKDLGSSKVTDDEVARMQKLIKGLKQAENPAPGGADANSAEPNAPADSEQ